jgi:hypothetical protein
MLQQRWLSGVFLVSGALAICGALLPWLTLYAGLYQYSGLIGLYGRLVLAAGVLTMVAGAIAARKGSVWLPWAGVFSGVAMLAFSAWLYVGMMQMIDRPDSVMVVARPGPGLSFVLAAGALMTLASAIDLGFRVRATR